MIYRVLHHTSYAYEAPVSSSYGEAHLLPRDLPGQRVLSGELKVLPAPDFQREREDFFGNRTIYFDIAEDHTTLDVTSASLVEVAGRNVAAQLLALRPWEEVRDALRHDHVDEQQFTLDSPKAPASAAAAAYAVPSFRPGRPVLEALADLSSRIYRDFDFSPGSTTISTPVEQVLVKRGGVCQDFAHLMIAALRSLGLAARYVSGYIETNPPPGRPKLQGADVSHAWASLFVPGTGWVDVDPTNDQFVGDRHVTIGWGRDYADVSPLSGVIFTDGDTERLEVKVDVIRLPDGGEGHVVPRPEPPPPAKPSSMMEA